MKPPRLTDPDFKYVNALKTDIAATFRRIQREMKTAEQEKLAKVMPIRRCIKHHPK